MYTQIISATNMSSTVPSVPTTPVKMASAPGSTLSCAHKMIVSDMFSSFPCKSVANSGFWSTFALIQSWALSAISGAPIANPIMLSQRSGITSIISPATTTMSSASAARVPKNLANLKSLAGFLNLPLLSLYTSLTVAL